MGFFSQLFKHGNNYSSPEFKCEPKTLYSPLKGNVIPLAEVGDEAFAGGMLGPGVGIIPDDGKLFAPADGTVIALFPTGHAIGMTTPCGMEILIHIGINTVELNGNGFKTVVKANSEVKAGDLLAEFDTDLIRNAGYDPITMVVISNAHAMGEIDHPVTGHVDVSDKLFSFH